MVLDIEQYRYQRFISDLSGIDIHAHGNNATNVVRAVRDWLANVSRRRLPAANRIIALYEAFLVDLPAIAAAAGFDPNEVPYVDYEAFVVDWLLMAPAP